MPTSPSVASSLPALSALAPPGSSAPPSASASQPSLAPAVAAIGDPSFDGGDVPKAKTALDKLKKTVEKCVNADGGVPSDGASIKLQFLVRAQGIAEGVEVVEARAELARVVIA